MKSNRHEISHHSRRILLEEYLQPMGLSQNAMARAIGVTPRAINEIVLGKRSITPAMSIRFASSSASPTPSGTASRRNAHPQDLLTAAYAGYVAVTAK